jgi:hypothetical protein
MDPWAVSSSGKLRTPAARKMAKSWNVKPAVDTGGAEVEISGS